MTDASLLTTHSPTPLTPRRDRLEAKLAQIIASGGTRSALRETVELLIDHLRLQGIPASRGHAMVMEVAARATRSARSGDMAAPTPMDWLTLVSAWASARYSRAD